MELPLPPGVTAEQFLMHGQAVLARQPFSVLLGAQLTALVPGRCRLELPFTAQLTQQNGFAHGGVLSYLADNALTYAGGTAMQVPVVTAGFTINYLRPGVGERLVAHAEVVHLSRTQAVCRCEVFAVKAGEEKLCAVAQGTIARLGGDGAERDGAGQQ